MSPPAGAPRIAVLGAGITGLAAAHRLGELAARVGGPAPDVIVFEATTRAGGIVATARLGDLVLEDGPDAFITDKPEALALCDRLGLTPRIIATRPEFRASHIVSRGRLVPTPAGFQLLAPARLGPFLVSPLLSLRGRARAALEPLIPPRTRDVDALVDESLASFVTRRLGREVLERMAQPMVGGIYGADPARLSMLATFPRFLRMEAEHGSVIRGLRRAARAAPGAATGASGPRYGLFASLAGGMAELVDALAARLPAGALRLATPVTGLAPDGAGWVVTTTEGGAERFDSVVVTLPAPAAGGLVAGFDPALAAALRALPRGSSATVTLAFRASDVAHPRGGAGFVVPRREGFALLGASFSDRKFAGRAGGGTAILRGFLDERALALSDEALVARVRGEFDRLLGIRPGAVPRAERIVRWPGAMPHYEVGHGESIRRIAARADAWPGLFLAGHSYAGVGLPDCIRGGEAAAEAAFVRVSRGGD